MTLATQCNIPNCTQETDGILPICPTCYELGYLSDYYEYRDLIDDGMSRYQAAVTCGLMDPHN